MPSDDTTIKQAKNKLQTAPHTVVNNMVEPENTYLIAVSLSQSH
jgi:hypothetical protein